MEAGGGDARTKLRRLFALAVSVEDMISIELAIREWGRHDQAVATRLQRIDNRRMDYMRTLFGSLSSDAGDVEARCLLAFSVFVANHYIVADHGGRSRADVIADAVHRLVQEA